MISSIVRLSPDKPKKCDKIHKQEVRSLKTSRMTGRKTAVTKTPDNWPFNVEITLVTHQVRPPGKEDFPAVYVYGLEIFHRPKNRRNKTVGGVWPETWTADQLPVALR